MSFRSQKMIYSGSKKAKISTWAWFAMAMIMLFCGSNVIYITIHDFMNNVATWKSNYVYIRSDHPYIFWIYNLFHSFIGLFCIFLTILFSSAGYKQLKINSRNTSYK